MSKLDDILEEFEAVALELDHDESLKFSQKLVETGEAAKEAKQEIKALMLEVIGAETDYNIEDADDKQSQGYNQAIHELVTVMRQKVSELWTLSS